MNALAQAKAQYPCCILEEVMSATALIPSPCHRWIMSTNDRNKPYALIHRVAKWVAS